MHHAIVWQRVEGALVFLAGLALFWHVDSGLQWWAALLIFFSPDLAFLGYVLGPRYGAAFYNAAHIYALGIVLLTIGTVVSMPPLIGVGALVLAHSGFDRMLGYGLKSPDSFSITHLGRIGQVK